MNDREQAISTLTEHLDHWKRLLSEGICTKDEGERTIDALTFAIESIKVDRAYEKVDFIEIPEGATVGGVIMAMFPNGDLHNKETEGDDWEISYPNKVCYEINYHSLWFDKDWWNSPYRKEQE